MEFDGLREEFKTQITHLRSKVMNRIKPKTIMSGQKLSGPMFADLVVNYVTAINKGAVPNIENAWTYISKGECQKSMEKSFESFCEEFTSSFEMHQPLFEYDLKSLYKEAKASAFAEFDQNAVGDVAPQYKDDLKTKMKQKYSQIKAENERVTRNEASVFLQNFFSPIEDKLRNQEYTTFHQYEQEVRQVESHFLEKGPPGPNREAICQEHVINALAEGAAFFQRNLENELKLQQKLGQESQVKLEARIQELKSDLNACKDDYENKMRSSENQKAQLIAKEQSMREALAELKQEKERNDKEWKERLQTEKSDANRQVDDFKNRMISSEENAKEFQRRMMASESESDKQKALLEQKVQFLENTVETLKQKEKDYQNEIKNQKKELMTSLKDSNIKYEEKINALNKKLDDYQDDINDKEGKISELEQKIYVINSSLSEKDIEVSNLKSLADEVEKLRDENEQLQSSLEENQKVFNSELQDERDNLKAKVEQLKLEITKKDSELQSEASKWTMEQTIQQQKIEFMETQVLEANQKIDENRKTHEAMLKAVQSRESEKIGVIEEADKKIEELKQEHYNEMKELEQRFEATNKRLCDELDKVRKSEGEATMKLKLTSTDNEKEISDLKNALTAALQDKDKALSESKDLEQQKQSLIQLTEERYRSQIDQLEKDLEEKKTKNQDELEEQQKKFEQDLAQLKTYYEQEKDRLEKKVTEEKNKGIRNVKSSIEDYEQRMQDEQNQHEDEMEMLQDDLRDKEDQLQAVTNKYEHELSLSDQKIKSLEEHLKETKKALDDIQDKNVTALDLQMNNFNNERKQHLDKIDELNQQLTVCEKKITTLENRTESLASEIKKKDEEIEQLKTEYSTKVKNVDIQIENLREEKQLLADQIMHKNLENGREEALTQQKIEFLENKNKELLQALSDSSTKYQEKLDSQKTEASEEVNDKIEKIISERDKIVQKFDEKKKAYKELEKATSVQITKLEREKAVNMERIENLEKKLNSEQEYSKKQIEAMREKIASLNDNSSKTVQEIEQKYFDMKQDYDELMKERADLQSNYEKDEALWKGQADFFKEQKEQLRNDLQESNRKLEAAIAQLQTKGSSVGSDKKQLDMINKMEKDYKDQINKLQDNHDKYVKELMDKNKELEAKNHSLQEKYELSYRDVNSSTKNLEKRLNEFEQRDSLQVEEIHKLKQERDRMLIDRQSAVDKEKEVYKAKLSEIEMKYKLSESEKGSLRFEIEKQQSKFNTEKDMLESNKNELQDAIARLEKRNETLVAQNEKLKEKNKNSRKFNKYGGVNSSSYLDTSQGRFMAGKFMSIAKEVEADQFSNNSGKENRFKTYTKFIGDGKDGEKSTGSGDHEKIPGNYAGKESESTNTLSQGDDKE